jgi:PTS system ascorbate-specific IIA component
MPLPILAESAIIVGAEADDWRAAVRVAGRALTASGATRPGYADEMIRMIEENGPYVVIAPGLALAHARPGPDVLADGLAVVTLATPVSFSVVLGLAIKSADAHIETVAELANVFNDSSMISRLANARSVAEVLDIMGKAS